MIVDNSRTQCVGEVLQTIDYVDYVRVSRANVSMTRRASTTANGTSIYLAVLTSPLADPDRDDTCAIATPGAPFDMFSGHSAPFRGKADSLSRGILMCYFGGQRGRAAVTPVRAQRRTDHSR